MTTKTRKLRPSPALVISCVALCFALVGTAVAAPKLAVRSAQIVNGTVRTVDFRDNAVTSPKIADATVTATDLGTDSVGSEEIAKDAVNSDEIAKDAVKTDEIADNAVASPEVAPDSLTAGDLAANSVGSSEVADESLTQADLGVNSVNELEVAANAISADELTAVTLRSNADTLAAGQNGAVAVSCQGNEQIISGGGASVFGVEMTSNAPSGNGWFYSASNKTAATRTITVYALCLAP
ncbi:MAG TPA: hypothetical protein VNP73_02595 [Actinomycetota bacterium]|nr:hypothetical protein [Actinomycetota bacterium]